MNDKLIDITIVLDRSGSMSSVQEDTIGGFNKFLDAQRANKDGEAAVSLVQFDDVYETVYAGKKVAEAPNLDKTTFVPRGYTALLDAIGKTIVTTGARFSAMQENDRPGKVLFVIVTDGGENASKEYAKDRVFEMIKTQRDIYKWDFVFLGANQDAIATAATFGLTAGKAMSYASNTAGTASAFNTVAQYASRSRSFASGAVAASANAIRPEDREEQAKAGVKQNA